MVNKGDCISPFILSLSANISPSVSTLLSHSSSLLDLDPLSSSGPSVGASAAPTSWGDLLGSEMGESMLPDPTLAVEPVPSPAGVTSTPAAAEPGVSLAPPPSAAAAATPTPCATNMDLLGDAFSTPVPTSDASAEGGAPASTPTPAADAAADSTGGETKPAAPAAASGAELMAAFDGLGDVLMPSMTPQAGAASSPVKPMGGDLDATMASMASNLGMGTPKPGENTMGGWSTPQGGAVGAGAPMMPMVRPGFGAPATPGAPMGSPGMAGSPRRPPPPKNALDDLNIKDFM
uniref:Synaptosome associated protein 91a n=1 Tax=Hucho hucho TaxID=62062 RepID=A0A4W5P3P6_9TELE